MLTQTKKRMLLIFIGCITATLICGLFGFGYYLSTGKTGFFLVGGMLFKPPYLFSDYFDVVRDASSSNNSYGNYLPIIYLFFSILNYLNLQNIFLFIQDILLVSCTFYLLYSRSSSVPRTKTHFIFCLIFSIFSYPIVHAIGRGNVEILVYLLVMAYVILEKRKSYFSSLFLGLAIAIKIVPAVFLLVSLNARRYWNIVLTFLSSIFFVIVGFISLKGSTDFFQNVTHIIHGFSIYKKNYMNHFNYIEGINFNHSIYSVLRYLNLKIDLINIGRGWYDDVMNIRPYYYAIIFTLATLLTVFVYKMKLEFWKVLTIAVAIFCLFPMVSADYKLLYVFLPLAYFLKSGIQQKKTYAIYSALFALLLAPKFFVWIKYHIPTNSLINSICLFILLCGIVIEELLTKKKQLNA